MRRESSLDFLEQLRAHAMSLPRRIDHDPVEVVGSCGPRRRPPAGVPDQLIAVKCADESVVVVARQALVEQLDRGRDLFFAEETGRPRQLLKPCAVRAPDGPQVAQGV